jgi:hypothetical protein
MDQAQNLRHQPTNMSDDQVSPERSNAQAFISAIGENRQAFQLFKESASKRGINISSPKSLMHQQQDYYERYIKHNKTPKQQLFSDL